MMMKSRSDRGMLIGLTGLAGSGKSTAAAELEAGGFIRLRFAGPLKDMMRALLVAGGASEAEARDMIDGDLKEVPVEILCGTTPRHGMQTLGTEWGRHLIGKGLWVNLTMTRALQLVEAGRNVVIDDVRFPDEAEAIRTAGGVVWRLTGRGGIAGGHASEGQQFPCDAIIPNGGTRKLLSALIMRAVFLFGPPTIEGDARPQS